MMTSEQPDTAFAWVWLPGAVEPVVAGRLDDEGELVAFRYASSYLEREGRIALYEPELPLRRGRQLPPGGLRIAGCLDDAGPDAWGQRVIMQKVLGAGTGTAGDADPAALHPLTYLLLSGSDRIGALDFQASPSNYAARTHATASLADLMHAADMVDEGVPLSPALDAALLHGSSVGGAWPKVLVDDGGRKLLAKFSMRTDSYPVIRGEYAAMELARRCGLAVAPVQLERVMDRDVLLVERFDRVATEDGRWTRRMVVSALTMLGLHELLVRHGSYAELADTVRARFHEPRATLRELFQRIAFNMLVGNTDDHPRNHAAFWDGQQLELTPAFDLCPQLRPGRESNQAMAYDRDGTRVSQLAKLVEAANVYLLDREQARGIIDHLVATIQHEWVDVCDAARLGAVDRAYFWRRQVLNDFAFDGYR